MRNITKLLTLVVLCLVGMQGNAQNVTIRGNNGSCIPAVKNGGSGDTFYRCNGFATWQHEQLCMVLTASDGTVLTPNGQLDNPANNLFVSSDGTKMQIAHGQYLGNGDYTSTGDRAPSNVCFLSLSLPSGYRFTGYTIIFTRPGDVVVGKDDDNYDVYLNPSQAHNDGIVADQNYNATTTFGETGSDFNTYITSASIAPNGTAKTIKRTADDMSNVLYFKLDQPSRVRTMIQIESAEFYFTAEENYTPLTPAGEILSPVRAVDIPFSTSKVDYGTIKERDYQGITRVSYSSADVTDLEANFTLYEAGAIVDGTGIDGISGKVVDYGEGSISSYAGYFKLESPVDEETDEQVEQVYFIETPTYVELSNGDKNPVGYRITGVEYDYATSITAQHTFYITYTYNGTKYYLNTSGRYTTTRTIWEMDNDGFISNGSGSSKRYIYFNNGRIATQSAKPGDSERFAIDGSNNIYQIAWPTYFIRANVVAGHWEGWNYVQTYIEGLINPDDYPKASYERIKYDGTSVDDFKLIVYDKTGSVPEEIEVSGNGTKKLSNLNNDAVKFGIIGTGLIRATLTLQALDPYLDQMEVVCSDPTQPQVRLSETFTASDFSVNGGEFFFYLPDDLVSKDPTKPTKIQISFENLKSQYFDDTYPGGHSENNSRLNFVRSLHYDAFGTSNNKIYNDTCEARTNQLERLKVTKVGTAPFKFNNADEVSELEDGDEMTYSEYPFSLENYAAAPNNGLFNQMEFNVHSESTTQSATRYVFTTDETRFNIAPTTAIQHRAYAFYKMIVHVEPRTYTPYVEFVPIYANTNYDNSAVSGGSTDENKAFYGAIVTAKHDEGGEEEEGYSSTKAIFKAINDAIENGEEGTVPESQKEILYLDFSHLKGVYQLADGTNQTMEDYSANNAANCLIFLPEGSSAPNNNVAYLSSEVEGVKTFQAANNIVLTDKQPFYSPYDIQVGADNYVMYTRKLTYSTYDEDVKAMVMLPFELTLEGGQHTNPSVTVKETVLNEETGKYEQVDVETIEGANSFWVKKMDEVDLSTYNRTETGDDYYGESYFANVTDAKTKANCPYMVLVDEETTQQEDGISFVAIQKGALIKATIEKSESNPDGWVSRTGTDENGKAYTYQYLYKGETVNASTDLPGDNVTLTSEGSYSGQKYDRVHSEAIFYFADNQFLNLYKLKKSKQYLYAYPFHPVYSFSGNYSSVNSIAGFNITFEPFVVDYIHDVTKSFNPDLAVRSGKGFIQMTSDKNQTVDIRSLNGTSYSKVNMNAGDSKTVTLPAGVYLVNNVKIIVK